MTNTPDPAQLDPQTPPGGGQAGDALAQLEALLQKTRANKGGSPTDMGAAGAPGGDKPTEPSQEEVLAQAEALARAEAEKEAAFEAQMAQAEMERKAALEAQQQQMLELAQTPQYQARITQHQNEEKEHEAAKAVNDGHQIIQVTTQKL